MEVELINSVTDVQTKLKEKSASPQGSASLKSVDYSKVYKKVDDFLDLGHPSELFTSSLSSDENKVYFQMISKMLKNGIVGYNYYKVNGKTEKHFIDTSMGDQRLANAKLEYNRDE